MLQPSFTGYLWNDKAFEGSLWPHRSSPFVCLVDTGAEIFMTFKALRNDNHEPVREESKHTTVRNGALTKVALFCFGAMPQALKLFSMRGIPMTQAIAAMYLLSSAVSLIRSLMVESPQEEIQKLLDSYGSVDRSLQQDAQEILESHESVRRSLVKVTSVVFGWGPHLVGLFLLWRGLVNKVGFAAPADLANAVDWVVNISLLLAGLYVIQHFIFMLMDKKPPIPRYPMIMIAMCTDCFCLNTLFAAPGTKVDGGIGGRPQSTFEFLVSLGLACYIVAIFLHYLVDKVYSPCKRCGRLHWRLMKRPCLVAEGSVLGDSVTANAVELSSHSETDSTQAGADAHNRPPAHRMQPDNNRTAPSTTSEDALANQHRAAEEGAVETSATATDQTGQDQAPKTMLQSAINLILRWILKLIWRLTLAYASLWIYTFNWIEWQVTKRRPAKILMMAFGLVNLVTAASYYLAFFDGQGTAAPEWSNIFG